MIDRDQRLAGRQGQPLADEQADHHPADQARTGSRRDRIDFADRYVGLVQHLPDQARQDLDMGASGDFRNHAAERAMRVILSDDGLREDLPVAPTSAAALSSHEDSRPGSTPFQPAFAAKPRLCASAGPMTRRASPSAAADRRCAGAGAHGRGRAGGGAWLGSRQCRDRRGQDQRRPDPGPAAGRGRRQGAVDQGAGYRPAGRRDRIARSIR